MKDVYRIFINIVGYVILLAGMLLSFYVCFQVIQFYSHPARMMEFFKQFNAASFGHGPSDFNCAIISPQLPGLVFLISLGIIGGIGLKIIGAGHRTLFGKVPKKVVRPFHFDSRITREISPITQRIKKIEELLAPKKNHTTNG